MANIKVGDLVYWSKTGVRAYWEMDLNKPVEFLSEEFLEGETVGGYPYAFQYAYDVPHEGTSVPPSIADMIAGTVTGAIAEKNGVSFYPIRMPFTFYNLDGNNRDDSTQSLKVFVNIADLTIETKKEKEKAENKALVDSVLSDNPLDKKTVAQADDNKKLSTGAKVIIGGVVVLLCVGIYWLVNRNKSNNPPNNYVQNPPNTVQQVRYVIPQPNNRLQTI